MADATHFRVFDANGHVFHEGKVDPKTGLVEFVAEGEVAHLVFYSGKGDEIVVEGSVDINQTGTVKVSALCPEPPPPVDGVVVTANERPAPKPVVASIV